MLGGGEGHDRNTRKQVCAAHQRAGAGGPAGAKVWDMEPGLAIMLTLTPVPPGERGCAFCGGLGHRITDCPKLEAMQTKQVSNIGRKDYLAHSSMDF